MDQWYFAQSVTYYCCTNYFETTILALWFGIQCQLRRLSDVLFGRCVAGEGKVSIGKIDSNVFVASICLVLTLFLYNVEWLSWRGDEMMQCRWVDVVSAVVVARVYHAPPSCRECCCPCSHWSRNFSLQSKCRLRKGHIFYSKNIMISQLIERGRRLRPSYTVDDGEQRETRMFVEGLVRLCPLLLLS